MKYISFVIATIFLAIPATLFASTPTKELRIIDHQVYLFDGNKKIQLTTTWNADIIEWALWEKLSGYESGYSKDECGVKVSMDKCLAIWYRILFQNKDIAIVKKLEHSAAVSANTISPLVFNFHTQDPSRAFYDREPRLQDMTTMFHSYSLNQRNSRLFADKDGNLVHTLKNSINADGNIVDNYCDSSHCEDRKYWKDNGYKERKFWANVVVHSKKISLEKLKNFAWIPLMY
jgi:hypothetical protein